MQNEVPPSPELMPTLIVKPKRKFKLVKNAIYSINGIKEVYKNEWAFRIEVTTFAVMLPIICILPIAASFKAVLFISMFFPLIAELGNSAVERTVNMFTEEYNELARHAKDAGAAVVFVTIIMTGFIWIFTLYFGFFGI